MINLINGKGQIGSCLQKYILLKEYNCLDIDIYHTWNFQDKNEQTQKNEYEKLKEYIKNTDREFLFISTSTVNYNSYYHYKMLSESYILNNTSNGYIIRLPNLIGKGICKKLLDGNVEAYGTIEILSIEDASKCIMNSLSTFNINNRVKNIDGVKIPATIIRELLNFYNKKI